MLEIIVLLESLHCDAVTRFPIGARVRSIVRRHGENCFVRRAQTDEGGT